MAVDARAILHVLSYRPASGVVDAEGFGDGVASDGRIAEEVREEPCILKVGVMYGKITRISKAQRTSTACPAPLPWKGVIKSAWQKLSDACASAQSAYTHRITHQRRLPMHIRERPITIVTSSQLCDTVIVLARAHCADRLG